MAAIPLRIGAFHEAHPITPQTATSTDVIDVEITPDASCLLDVEITKPAAAVASVILKRKDGASIPMFPSASSVGKTSIQVLDVLLAFGDTLDVDVDNTSGNKVVSGVGRRV